LALVVNLYPSKTFTWKRGLPKRKEGRGRREEGRGKREEAMALLRSFFAMVKAAWLLTLLL
jgi:hypothetical protein